MIISPDLSSASSFVPEVIPRLFLSAFGSVTLLLVHGQLGRLAHHLSPTSIVRIISLPTFLGLLASEVPDFAVCLFHVACMLVYDPVESPVLDRV
jgi:hypothetical protein